MAGLSEFQTFEDVDWTSGADAAGTRATGDTVASISLGGITGTVSTVYLYWNGLSGSTYNLNQTVTFAGQVIDGELVETGGNTCWPTDGVTSEATYTYRADVTAYVSGNGTYDVTNLGSGANGATLIVVYNDGNEANNRDLTIYEGAYSIPSNSNTFSLALSAFEYTDGSAFITLGVGDGQSSLSDNPVLANGEAISGSNSFQGSAGGDLWDHDTLDITSVLEPGSNTITLSNTVAGDCLTFAYILLDRDHNSPPTSSNDTVATLEDAAKILSLDDFGTYSDPESTPTAAVKITALETNGSLEYDTTGSGAWAAVTLNQEISAAHVTAGRLRFVPDENENGSPYATIGFKVSDGSAYSAAAYTLTVNVTAANDAPTANPDTDTIDENAAGSFGVVGNDTDPDSGDTLSVASIGDITVESDNGQVDGIGLAGFFNFAGGSISYDFSGQDTVFDPLGSGETATVTVNYTVQDGNGGTDSSTLTLTVNGVNDAPEAGDDFFGYGPSSEEIGGVVEDPLSGHWYYFNETYLSWEGARDAAESLGGHLATIPWFEENTFIYETFIQPLEGTDAVDWTPWIGASDATVEGEWRWVTGPEAGFQFWQGNASGTPLGFDNWSPGQPDDQGSNEDYAEMWTGGAWNDAPGGGGHYSIVEFSPPDEDSIAAISENFILDNDSDPDGPGLSISDVNDNSELGADVWFDDETDTVFYDPANSETIQGLSLGEYEDDTFDYEVTDGELTDTGTVTVRVWGRNDAPVIDLDGPDEEPEETALLAVEASETLDYTEGDPPTQIAPDATVSDVDTEDFSGGSLTVSFSANGTVDDVLGIENQGDEDGEIGVDGNQIYYQGFFIGTADEPGGSLVVDFDADSGGPVPVDAVQALIRAIVFSNESDDPSTDPRTVLFTLVDGDGTEYGGSDTGEAAATINVIAEGNDAPTSSNDTVTTAEDTAKILSLDDFGAYDDPDGTPIAAVTITALATNGSLQFDTTGSGTWAPVTLDQEISATDITAGRLRFVPDADENGSPYATIGFKVSDGSDYSAAAYTLTVDVTPVNDAPVAAIAPASYSTTEQVALSLKNNGLSVSDVDAGNAVVVATLTTAQGQIFVTPGTSGATVSGSGTHIVTLTGTVAQINALLNTNATSTVSYINNSDTPAPAAGLTLSVNDQGNSGSGGAKTGSDTVMVNVAAVNDAPVASIAPASYSTTEQVALSLKNNGLSVSDVDAGNAVVVATLTTAQGQIFVTPGTSGAAVGGSGTHIVTLTGTVAQINALLNTNATSTVSYINNSNTPAPAAGLTLSVNDQGNSGSGGAKTGSETVMVNVAAVNDAPVAAPDSAGVNEGASVTGNVIAGAAGGAGRDSDVDGTSLSIKGVAFQGTGGGSAGPGAALNGQFGTLVLQANGSFTYTGNANSSALVAGETGTDKFLYTLVDAGGATSTATLTVSVVGQNLVITNGSGDLFGQRGDDNITGDNGVNRIRGLEGNDRLDGAGGNDQLWGDQGNDQMFGGSGNDDLDGGDGDDTLRLGADNDRGWGGAGNDSIFGEAGDDTIQGDDGNDFLDAGDGNDTVYGGAGDDTIFLGIGNDTGDGGTGNDAINGGDGVDQITAGAGNDTLRGDAGNDLMWGEDGNDIFFGGDGNDQYAGGAGTDTLNFDAGIDTGWGGADNDVFTFTRGQAAGDIAQDFAGNGAAAGDRFVFQGYGTAAQGATFTQVDATHWQIHSADGLNEVITLANAAGVHASDFSFI